MKRGPHEYTANAVTDRLVSLGVPEHIATVLWDGLAEGMFQQDVNEKTLNEISDYFNDPMNFRR